MPPVPKRFKRENPARRPAAVRGVPGVQPRALLPDAAHEDGRFADARARAERKLYAEVFARAPTGIAVLDLDGILVRANARLEEIMARPAQDLLGLHLEDLLHGAPDDREREALAAIKSGASETYHREVRCARGDGGVLWVALRLALVGADDGQPLCFIAHVSDVTERRVADEALREATERFEAAFENAPVGMALVNAAGRPLQVNRALVEMTGFSADELLGKRARDLVHRDDIAASDVAKIEQLLAGTAPSYSADKRFFDASGHVVWASVSVSVVHDGDGRVSYAIVQVEDISDRRRLQDRLAHLADHDTLTGLANRRRFEEELDRQVARSQRYGETAALLLFDLDHFKYVNDTLGHSVGDELLKRVARTLKDRVRATDLAARLGGDEFAVLMPHLDVARAAEVASDLAAAIREGSIVHTGTQVHASASVGVAHVDETVESSEDLFIRADVAMYEAKQAGRNRAMVHDPERGHQRRMSGELLWSERLRQAVAGGGLTIEAQPIFDLASGLPVQSELLVRLQDGEGGVVAPGDFLPHAERFGYLPAIDQYVIDEAVKLLAADPDLTLEVNLSGTSICDPELPGFVEAALGRAGVSGKRLIFEFTETEALANLDVADQLSKRLGALGCGIAIDDFGSGFAGFGFVRNIEFDFLKIDGAFVRNVRDNPTDRLVVEALVHVAKGMGKKTIAEYVCDADVYAEVAALGVDLAQGYYLSPPVAPADLAAAAAAGARTPGPPAASLDLL